MSEYSTRKGYRDAFEVIGALADSGHPHRLKVAGRVQHQFRVEVDELVRRAPRPDRIDMLGFVENLPELYRGATAFLCCSRYEGFGLPVVEAMASGVPVVSYANSSLTEVVDDAGVLVPDGEIAAMIDATRAVVDAPSRQRDLREAGLDRARAFSWDACASIYADVFASVAR